MYICTSWLGDPIEFREKWETTVGNFSPAAEVDFGQTNLKGQNI